MPIPWIPILTTIGSIAGAWIGKKSQESANAANAENVQKQIDFQKEQSSTQYQRAVKDMGLAGLNPSLAYKQGGNQAQSGAAADNKASLRAENLQGAVDAYTQFANGTAQRQLIREQAAATSAQARKTMLEGNAIQPQSALGQSTDYISQYHRTELAKRKGEQFTSDRTEEQYMTNLGMTRQGTATARQQEEVMRTQATLNEQDFMTAWFRKNIAPYINNTAKTADGVGSITRAAKGAGIAPHLRYY